MGEKSPIKIGIVGLGRAGWGMHRKEIEKHSGMFQIVAACDTEKNRLEKAAEYWGSRTYTDIDDLIADSEVELVDIATRSTEHVPYALAALAAGKDVFLEKPISCTYNGAVRLKEGSSASKGNLYVRHNRRFEAAFVHIREIIASGLLGEVYEIKLRRGGYQRRNDWQAITASGGGQLLNWGPHIVDHALSFLDFRVADQWSHLEKVAALGDAEDHLKIVLRGKSGRVVDLEISGGSALKEPEYVVAGTRGTLTCDGSEIALRYIDPNFTPGEGSASNETPPQEGTFGNAESITWIEETIAVAPSNGSDTTDIWRHLYEAVREGKPYPITLDEAVSVMKVIGEAKEKTSYAIDREGI